MKKLHIISAVTDTPRFVWECKVFLYNLTKLGYKDITLLIFQQKHAFMQDFSAGWTQLEKDFPEVEFVYYKDIANITRICQIFHYIPLFRLYVLQEYFKKNPNLQEEAILYLDSDIIFTKYLDFTPYLQDDVNYVSWTGNPERTDNYLWQPYFDKKVEQVVPEKLEQYKKLDVLEKVAQICETTREQVTLQNNNIGGAQYLLKNINSQFWTDCFNSCCEIKIYLEDINRIFMKGETFTEKENNGFQSWCADMWAVLFRLISTGAVIKSPKELEFAWACDKIERLKEVSILHNAGITGDSKIRVAFEKNPDGTNKFVDAPVFYKGNYDKNSPFDDDEYLQLIIDNPISNQYCSPTYVRAILKAKYGRNI